MPGRIPMTWDMYNYYCTLPGPPPVGYVEKVGFVNYYMVPTKQVGYEPYAMRYGATRHDHFGQFSYIPYITPEEEIVRVICNEQFIREHILKLRGNGSYELNTFDGEIVTIPFIDGAIGVTIEEVENAYGVRQMAMKLLILENRWTGKATEYTIPMASLVPRIDWRQYDVSTAVTAVSFAVGGVTYNLGKDYKKYGQNHKVPTKDGYGNTVDGHYRDNVLKNSRGAGYSHKTQFARRYYRWFKGAGILFGIFGLVDTYVQWHRYETSNEKAVLDGVFGAIGFAGWPGTVVSVIYFIGYSPYIDDPPITVERYESFQLTLRSDNTRVNLPHPERPYPLPEQPQAPAGDASGDFEKIYYPPGDAPIKITLPKFPKT